MKTQFAKTAAALAAALPLVACHSDKAAQQKIQKKNAVDCIMAQTDPFKNARVSIRTEDGKVYVDLSNKEGLRRLAPSLGLSPEEAEPRIKSRRYIFLPEHVFPQSEAPVFRLIEKGSHGVGTSDLSNRLSDAVRREGDEIYNACLRPNELTPR